MRIQRAHIAIVHDTIMAALSFMCSLYLRLGEDFHIAYDYLLESTLLFTAVCFVVFTSFKLYRGLWRYASVDDLLAITKAATLAILIFLPLVFMFTRLEGLPRSVLVINWLVLLVLLGGPRFVYRLLKDRFLSVDARLTSNGVDDRVPVLLLGLNDNADLFLRYTAKGKLADYRVVAIIDNDRKKIGGYIHNVKIYGDESSLENVVAKLKKKGLAPRRIILADDRNEGSYVRDLLKKCESLGLTLAKLPKLSDFKSSVEKIETRPIAIEDLLGRPQKAPHLGNRQKLIEGTKVLVTGAGGTIGSELCRQIATYNPSHLCLVELSEYNLYAIEKELRDNFPGLSLSTALCDVRDNDALDSVFVSEKPKLVFHAAALKHVPIVEQNMVEGVMTNVVGTKNVAQTCLRHRVSKMVLISTDKAVNPSSIMGTTKRVAECYLQSIAENLSSKDTFFSVVRFGNVLGSSGSVIPLFQEQLDRGGPLTVTDPEMTRFFMTVPEAVELVLQASAIKPEEVKSQSAIFILDMGQPVRIKDLATQMIKLAGFVPDKDIKITYTGVRTGEKLHEELFYDSETQMDTFYEQVIYVEPKPLDSKRMKNLLNDLETACDKRAQKKLLSVLKKLVPEFKHNI